MFNILSYKGNANQSIIEILSHHSQNGHHQEHKQEGLHRIGGQLSMATQPLGTVAPDPEVPLAELQPATSGLTEEVAFSCCSLK
jgi:hypothetical protein